MKNWKTWAIGAVLVAAVGITMMLGHLGTFAVRLLMIAVFALFGVIALSLYKEPEKVAEQASTSKPAIVCEPVAEPAAQPVVAPVEPASVAQPVATPVEVPVVQQPAPITEAKVLTVRNITDADISSIQGDIIDEMERTTALQKQYVKATKLAEQKKKLVTQFMNTKYDDIDAE